MLGEAVTETRQLVPVWSERRLLIASRVCEE
jgi:hypothetical protein